MTTYLQPIKTPHTPRIPLIPPMTHSPSSPRALLILGHLSDRRTRHAHLTNAGFSVYASGDAAAGVMLLASFEPDLVILDATDDTPAILERIRAEHECLIIVLHPQPDVGERIALLQAGADDVLATTIHPEELDVRCEVMLRRITPNHGADEVPDLIRVGPLEVDKNRHEIRLDGNAVAATRIEFSLLEQLALGGEQVASREYLLEKVWGPHWVGDSHVVDVHLSNLRRKLDEAVPGLVVIHTVRSVGFRLSDELMVAENTADSTGAPDPEGGVLSARGKRHLRAS